MAHQTTPNITRQDFFATTLQSNMASGDTTAVLTVAPSGTEGYLVIDPNNPSTREVIYYNSKSGTTVTLPDATGGSSRGLGGTTVQAHTAGVLVEQRLTAEEIGELQNWNASSGAQNYIKSVNPTYVVSGLTLTTSASLTTTLASGVAYINGKRFSIGSASVTVAASKDTYLDIKENGDGTTSVVQVAVTNGASTGMPLTTNSDGSNALRVAKLVSSGTAITAVVQTSVDPINNSIYPAQAIAPSSVQGVKLFGLSTNALAGTGTNLTSSTPFLMQSGSTVVTGNGSGDATVTFPVAFPNGVLNIMVSNGDVTATSTVSINTTGLAVTGFNARGAVSASYRVNWLAIGW